MYDRASPERRQGVVVVVEEEEEEEVVVVAAAVVVVAAAARRLEMVRMAVAVAVAVVPSLLALSVAPRSLVVQRNLSTVGEAQAAVALRRAQLHGSPYVRRGPRCDLHGSQYAHQQAQQASGACGCSCSWLAR